MDDASKRAERVGWEPIYRSGYIPSRYQTVAAPNATVVEWTDTLSPGGFILDLGCGVGRHSTYLGGRGFRIGGVDISPTGIDMATKACAERGIAFEGHVSPMTMVPWPDATFDAALSTSTIHHLLRADVARAIGEVWRVLKPGGLFLVDFPSTERVDYVRLRELAASGQIVEVEPNTFVDERPDTSDIDGYLPHHYSDEADVRDLLGAFEIIKLSAEAYQPKSFENPGMIGNWVASVRKPAVQAT